jgi:hypothetical protein
VIREVVAPLARACRPDAVRWFFLRYFDEASHVRLRFMMSNRLGVSVQEESYLSVLIAGTLGESSREHGGD